MSQVKSTANAERLPAFGFGCSPHRGGAIVDLSQSIECAVAAGYQLFDTAELYGNEGQIGRILSRLGRREDFYIVSKVWRTNYRFDHVIAACKATLERLDVDFLDLYLLHASGAWRHTGPLGDLVRLPLDEARALAFPLDHNGQPALEDVPLRETWAAMEELLNRRWVQAIGVCNFERSELEELLRDATAPPSVIQTERHPYRPRTELIEYCRARGMKIMAHSPLSASGLLSEPLLAEIGRSKGKSAAQVALRWQIEDGIVPLPSSLDPGHVRDNSDVFDFRLSAVERESIARLSRTPRGDSGGPR